MAMRVNHTIGTLITADFLVNAGFSLFAPIFAVFVTKQIMNGSMEVVGFAAAITQIVKSVFQIPVARYLDRNHGEYDDFISLMIGNVLVVLTPVAYLFAATATHVYLIQGMYGLALAMVVPPWYAIFTRHIDKMQENIEWSFESVGIGISGAAAAALGGIIATNLGFRFVFLFGAILALVGVLVQALIFKDLRRKVSRGQVKPLPDRDANP